MFSHVLSSWLFAIAALFVFVSSAQVKPRAGDAQPNDVLQGLADKVKNLIPDSLGGLTPVLGTSKEYEYVVVGAGTAGSALAVRLAQSGARVALVEAGGKRLPDRWFCFGDI